MNRHQQAEIGQALRRMRVAAQLTIDGLADDAKVSPSQISRVENGHCRPTERWMARVTVSIGAAMTKHASADSNADLGVSA